MEVMVINQNHINNPNYLSEKKLRPFD